MYASSDTGKPNIARHRQERGRGGLDPAYADDRYHINLQSKRVIRDVLGGNGGESAIRNTAGTAAVDMIPSTKICSKRGYMVSE